MITHQFRPRIFNLIKDNLSDDLRRKPWKGHPNKYAGHCYVASETYYHFCGGKENGLIPMCGSIDGVTHWWLEFYNVNGQRMVADLTGDQFNSIELLDYYRVGRGKGFLTKEPSKRAQILTDRVILHMLI